MIPVRIYGAHFLPAEITSDGIAAAVQTVGKCLGIRGAVDVDVRPWKSRTMGMANPGDEDKRVVVMYPKALRREAYADAKWASVRHVWAWVLAHELVHIAQDARNGHHLRSGIAEAEAEALEAVYGPLAEKELEANG